MPSADIQAPPVLTGLSGATPAPLFWRALALMLDCALAGLAAWVILSRAVMPQNHPDAVNTLRTQWHSILAEYQRAEQTGAVPQFVFEDEAVSVIVDTVKTFFLTLLTYFVLSELLMGGATLGKKVFRLRAARWGAGDTPTFVEILCRCLFKVASLFLFLPFLLIANAIPVFLRPSRRAGHDYLARTIVTGDAPPPQVEDHRHDDDED